MNRRGGRLGEVWRPLAFALLVAAATAPSGVVAFQRSGGSAPTPKQGDTKVNPVDGQKYVWIPPGQFLKGCSTNDGECFPDEYPQRKITLTRGFWLAVTETTQAQFEKLMGYNPSILEGATLPADSVSWVEADAYCSAVNGRLPSDAEWEYAARAGTSSSRYGNLDDIAWYWNNSNFTTHPVGTKKPNAFGLYDMLGNVVEWTYTWYWVQLNQENINPTGPSTAEYKELRGGGWWDDESLVRVSYRRHFETTDEDYNIGFRCAQSGPQQQE
jgi:formylglycine-generating enzyme required for sulfatase activity